MGGEYGNFSKDKSGTKMLRKKIFGTKILRKKFFGTKFFSNSFFGVGTFFCGILKNLHIPCPDKNGRDTRNTVYEKVGQFSHYRVFVSPF